ncbi:MAG: STAS domain-containing protein [Candidatus Kapaibacterium sp.]|jgi:anti-sigma B factor antagonist
MHFTIEQEDAITIFRLKESRLDSMNSSALKAEFLILAQPDVETLIVDLSEVSYVDSAGLSALLLAQRQQSTHKGDVRLVGANENISSLLRLTQLDRIFPVYPTIEAAIEDAEVEEQPVEAGGSTSALKMSAIAAGGSFGAAALASLMMDRSGDDDPLAALGDEEFDDDEFEDDDFDEEDDLDDEDDLEDDAEEVEEAKPTDEEIEPDVIVEDVDLEDFDDDLDDDDDDDDLAEDDIF